MRNEGIVDYSQGNLERKIFILGILFVLVVRGAQDSAPLTFPQPKILAERLLYITRVGIINAVPNCNNVE